VIYRAGTRPTERNTEMLFRFAAPAWACGAVLCAVSAAFGTGLKEGGELPLAMVAGLCSLLAAIHWLFRWPNDSILMVVAPISAIWLNVITVVASVPSDRWPYFQAGLFMAVLLTALFTSVRSLVLATINTLVAGAVYARGDGTSLTYSLSSWVTFAIPTIAAAVFIHKLAEQRRATIAQLEVLALTDALTGIANRRRFMDESTRALVEGHAEHRSVTIVLVDIDHFKSVNDRFGHDAGDRVLVGVARALAESCRPDDIVGRLGGEEFAVLLVGATPVHAEDVVEKATAALASLEPIAVTASYGIAQARLGDEAVTDLLIRADAALYEAKRAGRNRAVLAPA
jgi:diguanylate cyclase (GGDEF)-like protein